MTAPSSFPRPRVSLRHLLLWPWAVTSSRKVAPPAVPTKEEDEAADSRSWMPPPFKIGDVRAAIPSHCWIKNPWRSLSYVLRDAVIVVALALAAVCFDSWAFWPVYWISQGTMFWAIFVLGHDCGHGSFSNSVWLNNLVGHLLHSSILVPYHGWRISHKTHHQNHGNVDKDESWHPFVVKAGYFNQGNLYIYTEHHMVAHGAALIGWLPLLIWELTEKVYRGMDSTGRKMRFTAPFPLLAFPVYLWWRSPGKEGSHFLPSSSLFHPNEKQDVIVSTVCWSAMVLLLLYLAWVFGPLTMLKLYGVPNLVFIMWLDLVTYLHHHGHGQKLPWYRGKEWSYLRGGLTTLDRDYGWINNIHHDIGTHVIHHLFPQIPHYNLVEATRAAKHVLGSYYREPEKSAPLPFHVFAILLRSLRVDHFVSDEGDVVFYQTDPQLQGAWHHKSN